jgi:hypothetical protein
MWSVPLRFSDPYASVPMSDPYHTPQFVTLIVRTGRGVQTVSYCAISSAPYTLSPNILNSLFLNPLDYEELCSYILVV